MRSFFMLVVFLFLFGSISFAQEGQDASGAAGQSAEVIVDDNSGTSDEDEYGVQDKRMMPPSENYDPNTGLPNVTESDTDGELQ